MFNVEFLHVIREFEYQRIVEQFPKGARILEIGGGTGYQALRLQQAGFDVVSIDVPGSIYTDKQAFPVQAYDGRNFPFADKEFDVVFSSNVLEHVPDLPQMHRESRRVLKDGGFCIHIMPTGAWRLWTNCAHYIELMQRLVMSLPGIIPRGFSRPAWNASLYAIRNMLSTVRHYAIVPRHGETGTALSEIYTFSVHAWLRHFHSQGLAVSRHEPLGLYYTGHMVFGARLPIPARTVISRIMGSACHAYHVSPARE